MLLRVDKREQFATQKRWFCKGNQVSVTVEAMNNAALALKVNSFFSTE
jgi:hypothetical protein